MSHAPTGDCDRGIAASIPHAPSGAPCPSPGLTLLASILGSSLTLVDSSCVNVALPTIGRELGAGAADLQWVVNAFLLPLGALILPGGAMGDHYGRRRLLLIGLVLFALASLVCAISPGLTWLLVGRGLQGLGSALVLPSSLALLGAAFEGAARGRAIGTWAAAGAVAGALGPLLGGWLVDVAGWRAIFLVNLPAALVAIVIGWRHVGESVAPGARALDWPGTATVTAGLAALTAALTRLSGLEPVDAADLGLLALGSAGLAAFLLVEWRRGSRAMMPFSLFGTAEFAGLTILTFLLYGALNGLVVLLPTLLIETGGYSALAAGAALLPLPLVIGLASRGVGQFAARRGPRLPLSLGALVVAGGFLLAARIDPAEPYWRGVLPALLVVSCGMSGAVAPLTSAVIASVDARHIGTASGFNSAMSRIGGLVAVALLGFVLARHGPAMQGAFALAARIGALVCLGGAAAAFLLLRPRTQDG